MQGGKADNRDLWIFLHLGWTLAATYLVLIGGGILLDKRLGTSPLLVLLALVLSIAASIAVIFRAIRQSESLERKK